MVRLRRRSYELLEIGRGDDPASRYVDLALITLITLNVASTVLESVASIEAVLGEFFQTFDRLSVAIFSVEYLLRLWSYVESNDPRFSHPLRGRLRYAATPIAMIDLLAVAPFYLAAFVSVDLRFLRVLRILRILKLSHYFSALNVLLEVVRRQRSAFGASFLLLMIGVLFAASGIYLVEHEEQPAAFGSIPSAMWWSVVTLTTVGYGDAAPVTVAGKLFGASITVLGVGMVALPTGILASGFAEELRGRQSAYGAELTAALEDGVIDEEERAHLEEVREDLSLSEEDVDGLGARTVLAYDAAPMHLEKCPHCGESLERE